MSDADRIASLEAEVAALRKDAERREGVVATLQETCEIYERRLSASEPVAAKVADARYFEGGQDLSNDPIHVAAVDLQIALLGASEAAHRLTVIARDSEEALAAHRKGAA